MTYLGQANHEIWVLLVYHRKGLHQYTVNAEFMERIHVPFHSFDFLYMGHGGYWADFVEGFQQASITLLRG